MLPERPKSGDIYYNGRPSGISVCITGNYPKGAGNRRTGYPGLDRLPNCVGYAVGFFNASNNRTSFDYLGNWNASYLPAVARNQGFEVTKEPTVGGIMCWLKNGSAGHCCVVRTILDENTIITAESEWNGVVYHEYTRRKGDGHWREGCYWMGSAYRFIGCIKNPAFEVENMTIDELIETMTPEQAYKLQQKAKTYTDDLKVSGYASAACQKAVEIGAAADGNQDGSVDAPKTPLLRQDFFVFLNRMGLLQKEV